MRNLVFLLVAVVVVAQCASHGPECNRGESYWCSSLKVAQQCGAFQHCMDTVWSNQVTKTVRDGDDVCTFCQSIVDDVRKFLEDQKDQEMIKQYLESACAIIPDQSMAAECKDLVDNYLDVVLELLATEMDPQTVCSLMGLCNTGAFRDTSQHHVKQAIQRQQVVLEPVCTDCKKFFTDIKNMVTSPATEKELEDYIEQNLCSMMGSLQDYCKQMIEAYIPEILDMVSSQLEPSDVCAALGFCNSTSAANHLLSNMRLQKSPLFIAAQQVPSEEACLLCKTVISELQSLDKDATVQAEVEQFLKDKLCSQLGSLQKECETTVDQYLPELFELVASELDPDTVCKFVGFCSTKKQGPLPATRPASPVTRSVGASAQCVLCEFIMKEVDGMLDQNATKEEIMAALNEVCDVLPDTIKQECEQFVKQYGPAIIAILQQEMDPQVVCTFLGLCKSAQQLKKAVGDGELCGTCETLIQYLDSLLEENSTITEIEQILEKVCNFLPTNLQKECDDIVTTYGPAVIQLLAQFADPREVCTALGLCNTQTGKTVPLRKLLASKPAGKPVDKHDLLGSKECTWGPSYWCDNMDNAIKCQAVEHCQKHIWQN